MEVGTPKSRGTRDERKKAGLNFNTVVSQTGETEAGYRAGRLPEEWLKGHKWP